MRTRDIIVLFACLSLGGVAVLVGALCYTFCANDLDWMLGPTGRVAVYDDMELRVSDDKYFQLATNGAVPKIYLRAVASGERFFLPALTEGEVQRLYANTEGENIAGKTCYFLGNQWSGFIFENGKLVGCSLQSRDDIAIGRNRDGPNGIKLSSKCLRP